MRVIVANLKRHVSTRVIFRCAVSVAVSLSAYFATHCSDKSWQLAYDMSNKLKSSIHVKACNQTCARRACHFLDIPSYSTAHAHHAAGRKGNHPWSINSTVNKAHTWQNICTDTHIIIRACACCIWIVYPHLVRTKHTRPRRLLYFFRRTPVCVLAQTVAITSIQIVYYANDSQAKCIKRYIERQKCRILFWQNQQHCIPFPRAFLFWLYAYTPVDQLIVWEIHWHSSCYLQALLGDHLPTAFARACCMCYACVVCITCGNRKVTNLLLEWSGCSDLVGKKSFLATSPLNLRPLRCFYCQPLMHLRESTCGKGGGGVDGKEGGIDGKWEIGREGELDGGRKGGKWAQNKTDGQVPTQGHEPLSPESCEHGPRISPGWKRSIHLERQWRVTFLQSATQPIPFCVALRMRLRVCVCEWGWHSPSMRARRACTFICVSACVCDKERERKRETETKSECDACVCACVCVWERKRTHARVRERVCILCVYARERQWQSECVNV